MTTIHKSSSVPYSAQQMYDLVNDIESYPDFLPWCSEATILSSETEQLRATLTLHAGKIKQSFTTQNKMLPGKQIKVELVKGPFKHLHGLWQFQDNENTGCMITLDMNFEYKNRLIKTALSSVFNKILNTLVDSFINRAHQLYGK